MATLVEKSVFSNQLRRQKLLMYFVIFACILISCGLIGKAFHKVHKLTIEVNFTKSELRNLVHGLNSRFEQLSREVSSKSNHFKLNQAFLKIDQLETQISNFDRRLAAVETKAKFVEDVLNSEIPTLKTQNKEMRENLSKIVEGHELDKNILAQSIEHFSKTIESNHSSGDQSAQIFSISGQLNSLKEYSTQIFENLKQTVQKHSAEISIFGQKIKSSEDALNQIAEKQIVNEVILADVSGKVENIDNGFRNYLEIGKAEDMVEQYNNKFYDMAMDVDILRSEIQKITDDEHHQETIHNFVKSQPKKQGSHSNSNKKNKKEEEWKEKTQDLLDQTKLFFQEQQQKVMEKIEEGHKKTQDLFDKTKVLFQAQKEKATEKIEQGLELTKEIITDAKNHGTKAAIKIGEGFHHVADKTGEKVKELTKKVQNLFKM